MITTWGAACGMDDYARDLSLAVSDALEVVVFANREDAPATDASWRVFRDWDPGSDDSGQLLEDLGTVGPAIVHIQFNWGGISLGLLEQVLDYSASRGVPCVLQLHATYNPKGGASLARLASKMAGAAGVIVHGAHDEERLRSWGVADNVWRWRLGENPWRRRDRGALRGSLGISEREPVIATFGFLQPRKRTLEVIRAVELLRDVYPQVLLVASTALHPRDFQAEYYLQCRAEIIGRGLENHVEFVVQHLREEVAMTLLEAADVILLPYADTLEGASAAAKFCARAGRPMVLSGEPLFDAYAGVAFRLGEVSSLSIAEAVEALLGDPEQMERLAKATVQHTDRQSWRVVGPEYVSFVLGLANPREQRSA